MVKIYSVGGYTEVGKNMTVIELEDDAFLIDNGLYLPAIVGMQEGEKNMTEKGLKRIGALADDSVIKNLREKVRAQFIGHGHLDHVGGVPFSSDKYNAPIYGTPFTIEILKSLLADNNLLLKNKLCSVKPDTVFTVQGKKKQYRVEFIGVTHSILQTVIIAIHTDEGVILYCNDFKLDPTPVYNSKTNMKRLREIGKEGVLCMIVDSLYADTERKTPSEKIARALLDEIMTPEHIGNGGLVVTSFSSHIERLKSIVDFGTRMNRKIIFLGRSLDKYCRAAQTCGLADFTRGIQVSRYRSQVESVLKKAMKNKSEYLLVCTGHQGEPGAVLERISRGDLPYRIEQKDSIIFSSSVIPTNVNREQFSKMENRLKKYKPRIYRDAHVSGHASREDLRDFLKLLTPRHVIPSHADPNKIERMMDLLKEENYKRGKNAHCVMDGGVLKI